MRRTEETGSLSLIGWMIKIMSELNTIVLKSKLDLLKDCYNWLLLSLPEKHKNDH